MKNTLRSENLWQDRVFTTLLGNRIQIKCKSTDKIEFKTAVESADLFPQDCCVLTLRCVRVEGIFFSKKSFLVGSVIRPYERTLWLKLAPRVLWR